MQIIKQYLNPIPYIKKTNLIIGVFCLGLLLFLLSSFQILNAEQDFNYVDLNNWDEVGGTADWSVLQGGRTLKQDANTSTPTFYVSNTDYMDVAIRGTIKSQYPDDDFIGFVLGWESNNSKYDFLLIEWGENSRSLDRDGTIRIAKYDEVSSSFSQNNAHNSFITNSHIRPTQILQTFNMGWQRNKEYKFEFLYTSSELKLILDGDIIFNLTGQSFSPGKFGFYGNSQQDVTYGNVRVVDIDPNANAPVANPDRYGVSKNTTLTVTSSGLLFNDYDPNLDAFEIELESVTDPSNGTLSLSTDGAFTYTPNPNYEGQDSFTYNLIETSSSPQLRSETVTVTLNVIDGTNVAPSDIEIDLVETFSTFENGVQLATVTAIDSNAGDFHDYLLINNSEGRFGINGNRILLAEKSSIVYGNSYNIVVRAVDFGNLSVDRTLSIKMPYSITYNLAGGINNISNPAVFTVSSSSIELVSPSRFGFTFDGWFDQVSGGSIITEIPTGTQTNQAIYAQWTPTPDNFNINYDLSGGNNAISNPAIYNVLDLPLFISPPTKTGFVFDGWQIYSSNETYLTPSGLISIKLGSSSIQASIHNYQLVLGNRSWTDARDYCANLGGYLTTVTSSIEWQYILQKILQNSNPDDRFWLGGQAMEKSTGLTAVQQDWQWLNNEGSIPLNSNAGFHNWATGEPNNSGGEYYLTTWGNQTWNDLGNDPSGMHGLVCEFDQLINVDSLITLSAVYIPNTYSITFNTNGGTSITSTQYDTEQVLNLPSTTKTGFVFGGWYTDSNLTQAFTDTIMPPNDLVLYAKWDDITYSINYLNLFDAINDENNPISFQSSSSTLNILDATRTGFTFLGWFTNSDFTGNAITQITSGSIGDISLYAKWQINQYTISFNANGGNAIPDLTADYLSSITIPSATRQGYRFEGWFENGTRVTYTEMPLENRTLEAQWTPIPYTITFVNSINGEQTTLTANFNAPIQMPQIIEPGYTFGGWLENNRAVRFTTMPFGNRTLVASFNARNYTISFNAEIGSAPASIQAAYRSSVSLPTMNVEHYTFKGWQGPNGLIEGSMSVPIDGASLTAVFEPKLYTMSFSGEGIELPPVELEFDAPISLPTPSRSGYRFTGWTLNGQPFNTSKMPGENITLVGAFEKTELVLRLVSEGRTIRETTLYLNDSFTLPAAQKRGHTFDGWYEGNTRIRDGVMPARNLSLEARFLINSYPVTFVDHDSVVTERFVYESSVALPVRDQLGYRFIGWARNGQLIDQLIMTDAIIELSAVYQPLVASMTFVTPLQQFEASLTTNQPLANLNPLNVPDGYSWVGYFTLPFGAGESIQAGRMIDNAHDTMMVPYYLRAGQVFESSSNRLSTEPYYYGNLDSPVSHPEAFPWFESITFITTSMALIGLYVASKGGKRDETIL